VRRHNSHELQPLHQVVEIFRAVGVEEEFERCCEYADITEEVFALSSTAGKTPHPSSRAQYYDRLLGSATRAAGEDPPLTRTPLER